MLLFLSLIQLVSSALIVNSHALTSDEIKTQIKAQASLRHPDPPSDFWNRLGPEALPVLKQMIGESTTLVEKTWIIDGLAHFNDPSVASILQEQIKTSDNVVFKKKLLSALIQSQGDSALDFVEPYFQDPDVHVRLAVAQGVKQNMSSSRALERLRVFQSQEKESWVKKALVSSKASTSVNLNRVGGVRSESILDSKESKVLEPLREKDWIGEWNGVYVRSSKAGQARVILTREGLEWKVELRLPKASPIELKASELEISSFQTGHLYWLEMRNKKEDAVFLASRKPKTQGVEK